MPAAQQVEVQMKDGLTCAASIVYHQAVSALIELLLTGELRCESEHTSDQLLIRGSYVIG